MLKQCGVGVLLASHGGGPEMLFHMCPGQPPTPAQTRIIQPQMSRVPRVRNSVLDVVIIIITMTNKQLDCSAWPAKTSHSLIR